VTHQHGDDASRIGTRRARLEQRRQARTRNYGRFLWLSAIGSIIPGVGLIAAGRRSLGAFFVGLFVVLVLGGIATLIFVPFDQLSAFAVENIIPIAAVLGVLALMWLIVALMSHRVLEPRGLSTGRRLVGALVVVVASSLVVAPLALGSRYALTTDDALASITLPGLGGLSNTTPDVDTEDPWAGKPRVNVLLLGGDGADEREGERPDTQMVASIDTQSGETTLLQLPRNLQDVPFAEDSPLAEIYPEGFNGPDGEEEYYINAVYRNVPALHPELFEGVDNPGADANKWAVEGALGIEIDYYALVNLEGFQTVVDALGGVTVDVPRDIPVGGQGAGCYGQHDVIEAGQDQRLTGYQALWFARSRCDSSDYDRMERQRCVMGAIMRESDPMTLARRYQALAGAAKEIVRTDIPREIFPDFIQLGLRVKDATITSLPFTDDVIAPGDPDYERMHEITAEALEPAPESEPETEGGGDGSDAGSAESAPTEPSPEETSGTADSEQETGDDGTTAEEPSNIADVC